MTLLKVNNLKTVIDTASGPLRAVDGVSFEIQRGETFALLGESGCGKSMTALSIIGLVPEPSGRIVDGEILLNGEDISRYSEIRMRSLRGNRIAMIFQEPMTSLNPVLTVADQIRESITTHKNIKGTAANKRVLELLNAVGIPDPERRMGEYPHQLSGGMKQRVMIAIALAGDPDLLIADEPTTALDVTIQAQVLDLLKELQQKTGMAILLITHDLGVVYEMADRVGVMYAGQIVELANRKQFFDTPRHPYSQRLFRSLPSLEKREHSLEAITGTVPALTKNFKGCRFEARCTMAWEQCREHSPPWLAVKDSQYVLCHWYADNVDKPTQNATAAIQAPQKQEKKVQENTALLKVNGLKVHFPIHKGLFQRVAGYVYAVDDVELNIKPGETLALVGESGCGKTTVGKGVIQLLRAHTKGRVEFNRQDLTQLFGETLRKTRAGYQIIFQDPYSSMNPRMRVGDIIEEGMIALGVETNPERRVKRVAELLTLVGLQPDMRMRYPHEFSGGQRQRICIARALAVNPKLIICDEPTSALDVSIQAQILNLLKDLQNRLGLAYLFITHNISVVAYLADTIAVMYLGRIVEQGPVAEVLNNPRHPYTKALLAAVPEVNRDRSKKIPRLGGDLPSPSNPPQGCHFHPRCPEVFDKCRVAYPERTEGVHHTRCHLYS